MKGARWLPARSDRPRWRRSSASRRNGSSARASSRRRTTRRQGSCRPMRRPTRTQKRTPATRRPRSTPAMRRRLLLVLAVAPALAGVDLATKALVATEPIDFDPRSSTWVALSIAVVCGSVLLALLPSRAVAVASALIAGGALGNLLSAAHHDGRVPNPFVVSNGDGGVAFNLADVLVMTGILLQTV